MEIRFSTPRHDIHGGQACISLGGLGIEAAIAQAFTKACFETRHGGFGQTATVIATVHFPGFVPMLLPVFKDGGTGMGLSIGPWRPRHRVGTRWNQGRCLAVQESLVTDPSLVGAIGGHGSDRLTGRYWRQQGWKDLGIMDHGGGQFRRNDRMRAGIPAK